MPVRFYLVDNQLTADPNDFMAVTTDAQVLGEEQIIEQMISRGSTVTKAEALGVLEEFSLSVSESLKNGFAIRTPLFSVYPTVQGVFNAPNEGFTKNKHSIRLNMRPGKRLTDSIPSIAVERVEGISVKPVLVSISDLKTGTVNDALTIGQIFSIKGNMLKLSEHAESGVYFIDSAGVGTKVNYVVKNKPTELLCFVPETLSIGTYSMEIRTHIQNRKTISVTRCDFDITLVS